MQTELDITLLLFNAMLGIILVINVIILLYIKRLQDERYVHILSLAGRNAFVFLMLTLPLLSALQFLSLPWIDPGVSVFVLWISALIVLYGSSYYYYRS
ncbi:MAG: hypothetical protein ACW97G_14005 [Candidatus Thorarchaeota archaeon]